MAKIRFSEILQKPHLLAICLLSFSSGLPLLLMISTFPLWLQDVHCNMAEIGYAFLISAPYSLKFLWAPFVDQFELPLLTKLLGKRRAFALMAQLLLFVSTLLLAQSRPQENMLLTVFLAFCVCFFAATHDIVVDAYRIERLDKTELAIGTAVSGIGFRLGLFASGAGSLYLAHYFDWHTVFTLCAFAGLIGPVLILIVKEPNHQQLSQQGVEKLYELKQKTLGGYFLMVFKSFLNIARHPHWLAIIFFILFFKISDSIPNSMSSLCFQELGFSKAQIAQGKAVGILMMIASTFLGGVLLQRMSLEKGILIGGLIQLASPVSLYFLSYAPDHHVYFLLVQAVQAGVCGIGSTAFVAYLSSLCSGGFTATQFSVIYSFSSISRILLSYLATKVMYYIHPAWSTLFLATAALSLLYLFPVFKILAASNHKVAIAYEKNAETA